MKNLTITSLAFLIFNFSFLIGFSQTTGDQEVVKLRKDITILKQENDKLKKQVAGDVNALNKSIEDTKGFIQGADNRINMVNDLNTATNSEISLLQEETNNRHIRVSRIIKIAILVIGALMGIIILLFFKFKRGLSMVNQNLDINEKAMSKLNDKLTELKDDFSRQITSTQETLYAKIKETHQLLNEQIDKAKKASDSADAKIKK